MHSEAWGDPRDPREHRGGHRMRMRMRGGPGPGPGAWGGGPFGTKDLELASCHPIGIDISLN